MRKCGRVIRGLSAFVIVLGTVSGLTVLSAPSAFASGTPDITLTEVAPTTVLYGTQATIHLTATNPPGQAGFNLSFNDALPLGVTYVPGSTVPSDFGDPQIITLPSGAQTIVWSNVADLQPNSSQEISFKVMPAVEPDPNAIAPGVSYTDAAAAYVNSDPRYEPQFDPTTGDAISGATSYTGSDTASGTTTVTALSVSKIEPSPEAELPRGVHDHQTVYTITVTNNEVNSTDDTSVTDDIPAGLEFLGCGTVDNTSSVPVTNPGGTNFDEYPGSGSLVVSPLAPATCPTPVSVDTVTADPVDSNGFAVGAGVYTEVTWDLGDLSPNQSITFEYLAAVPLRANALWPTSPAPSPTGLTQAANLDNNTGPETTNDEALENVAVASGTYTGNLGPDAGKTVSATGQYTVHAVDLAIQKSVDNPNFVAGQLDTWTLNYQTSEYRYSTDTVITDTLPSGMCPLSSTTNYATDSDASPDCDPVAGQDPSTPYTSVVENADGSFTITWDLGVLPPNTDATITFPSRDRAFYQSSTGATTPTLSGDTITNNTTIEGTTNTTCYEPGTPVVADPTCANPGALPIYSGEGGPESATNSSSASQSGSEPTIIKRVAEPANPLDCSTATYTTVGDAGYPPLVSQGDSVCFQLEVDFPAGLHTKDPVVDDFLPPNTTYNNDQFEVLPQNTTTNVFSQLNPSELSWTLGDSLDSSSNLYVSAQQVFLVDFSVTVNDQPTTGNNFAVTANLMKMSAENTQGLSISLRSSASYNLTRPTLGLTKGITSINGVPNAAPYPSSAIVADGDVVGFELGIPNTGGSAAQNVQVWDVLPPQISCADIAYVSTPTGACTTSAATPPISTITWTVPGPIAAGASGAIDFTVTVPAGIAADEALTNNAGVRTYQNTPNNGGIPVDEVPSNNIDPDVCTAFPLSCDNSPAANASATLTLLSPTMTKTRTTSASENDTNCPGGDPSCNATIGEDITYTVTTTLPANTTYNNGAITDTMGTTAPQQSLLASPPATVTFDGSSTLPPGFNFTASVPGNSLDLGFPASYSTGSSAHTVIMTYTTVVNDVAANVRQATISNQANFNYDLSNGTSAPQVSASVNTTVVEPLIGLSKSDNTGVSKIVVPGQSVNYTVTVSNSGATDVSPAHDINVTDTLPVGVSAPSAISNGGTYNSATRTITWALPTTTTLAPGGSLNLTYTVTVDNPAIGSTQLTNDAQVNVASLNSGGRTTGTGYQAVASDTVSVVGPTLVKVANPTSQTIGTDTQYTITVTIPSDVTLPGATVDDTLPNGMVFDAYGPTVACTGDATVCATIAAANTPTAGIGTPTTGTGSTALGWYLGNLASGTVASTVTLTYTAYPNTTFNPQVSGSSVVKSGDTLTNLALARWNTTDTVTPPTTPPTSSTFASPSASAPITVVEPNLSITKTASTSSPTPGTPFTYTLTVKNNGNSPAYTAAVNDPIPASLDYQSANAPVGVNAGSSTNPTGTLLTWSIPGPVAPGSSVSLTFTVILAPSIGLSTGQTITNTATITTYYGDPNGPTNATRYRTYGPTSSSAMVKPVFPALHIVKSDPAGNIAFIGTPFAWTAVVTNTSAANADDVSITDTLPAYFTYDTGTVTLANGTTDSTPPTISTSANIETLTWTNLGPLSNAVGQTITLNYTATPGVGAVLGSAGNTNSVQAAGNDDSGASGNHSGPYISNTSTAQAFINAADLAISKTDTSGGIFTAGSSGTYTVTVTNNGPSVTSGITTVVDTLPLGETLSSDTQPMGSPWTCTSSPPTVTCTSSAVIAVNGTSDITLTVNVDPSVASGATLTNGAQVTGTVYDPNLANNTTTHDVTVATQSVLSVVKQHTGDFTAGGSGSYEIDVTNEGPSDSPGPIVVTDSIPTEMVYDPAGSGGTGWVCNYAAPVVTCSYAAGLAFGQVAPAITINVTVPHDQPATTVTNTAFVSGPITPAPITCPTVAPPPGCSNDPTNIVTSAGLQIVKSHSGDFTPGLVGDGTWTLTVTNPNGPSDATDVSITDPLPADQTFVSGGGGNWSCSADVNQVVTCDYTGTIAPGVTEVVSIIVTVASSYVGPGFTNTATVHGSNSPDAQSTDTTGTAGPTANLSITKVATTTTFTAGDDGTYLLAVTNNGPSDVAGTVTVVDTLPTDETYVSGGTNGWTCPTAPAPSPITCTLPGPLVTQATTPDLSLTVLIASSATGSVVNNATASSATPGTDGTVENTTPIVTSANLTMQKIHSGAFTPGTVGTYNMTVGNTGPSDATDVVVTDPLPAGLTFVSGTGTDWTCSADPSLVDVTCDLSGTLAAGGTTTFALQVQVDPGFLGTSIDNTATASASNSPSAEGSDSIDTVTPIANLALTKVATTATFTAGQNGTYTLVATNNGPSDAAGPLTLTDTLPAGETYVSATGTGWVCPAAPVSSPFTCTYGAGLAAHQPAAPITLVIAVATNQTGSLTNTAEVTSPTSGTPGDATVTTPVEASADLAITKTASAGFTPGANSTYTLVVINNGPSDAAGPVTVSDTLPAGETFVSATPSDTDWTCTNKGQAVSCSAAGGMVDMATETITLIVTVGGAAYPAVTNTATVSSPTPDPNPANNTSSVSSPVASVADLSIVKSHTGAVIAGEQLTYSLVVNNAGPTPDTGPVTVTDVLPNGLTFVTASASGWTCTNAGQTVTCTRPGAYAVGLTSTIALTVMVGAAAVPSVTNTATVAGTGTDPNPANNTSSDPATVAPGVTLAITKTLVGTTLVTGADASYLITVSNLGPSDATGVTMTDNIPTGLQAVSASGTGWTCTVNPTIVHCAYGPTLANGASAQVTVVALVTATTGTITNGATAETATSQVSTAQAATATTPTAVSAPPATAISNTTAASAGALAFTGLNILRFLGLAVLLTALGLLLTRLARRRLRRSP